MTVPCPRCGGSGFNGYGTGYGDVCDDCAGSGQCDPSEDVMDNNKAQIAALGARCGSPRCPHTREDECAASIARVTAERDALRGALVALTQVVGDLPGAGVPEWVDTVLDHARDVLGRVRR